MVAMGQRVDDLGVNDRGTLDERTKEMEHDEAQLAIETYDQVCPHLSKDGSVLIVIVKEGRTVSEDNDEAVFAGDDSIAAFGMTHESW